MFNLGKTYFFFKLHFCVLYVFLGHPNEKIYFLFFLDLSYFYLNVGTFWHLSFKFQATIGWFICRCLKIFKKCLLNNTLCQYTLKIVKNLVQINGIQPNNQFLTIKSLNKIFCKKTIFWLIRCLCKITRYPKAYLSKSIYLYIDLFIYLSIYISI